LDDRFDKLNGCSIICDVTRNGIQVIEGLLLEMEKSADESDPVGAAFMTPIYKIRHRLEEMDLGIKNVIQGNEDPRRQVALKTAWSYLGKPYLWGGDDPMAGFDCSGFIVEILKSVGILPRKGDWTAQGLWDKFLEHDLEIPYAGCLVFWESNGRVIHVEMCITSDLSIGASGGGSRTDSLQDAIDQNAYIKIRPFETRKGVKGFMDPFL
jgi:hypothetical protein